MESRINDATLAVSLKRGYPVNLLCCEKLTWVGSTCNLRGKDDVNTKLLLVMENFSPSSKMTVPPSLGHD